MNSLKIATSLSVRSCFTTQREVVDVLKTDFCDIGAAVVSVEDVQNGIIDKMNATGLKLPIFVAVCCEDQFPDDFAPISPGYLSCVMPKSSSTVSKWKLPCVVIKKVCCHLSLVH